MITRKDKIRLKKVIGDRRQTDRRDSNALCQCYPTASKSKIKRVNVISLEITNRPTLNCIKLFVDCTNYQYV